MHYIHKLILRPVGDDLTKLKDLEEIQTEGQSREYAPGASKRNTACSLLTRRASRLSADEGDTSKVPNSEVVASFPPLMSKRASGREVFL